MLSDSLGLFAFIFLASITPGPNNTMLASSSAVFGWRRSLRHALGVVTGTPFCCVLMSLFIGFLGNTLPALIFYMQILGLLIAIHFSVKIIYSSWRSSFSRAGGSEKTKGKISGFLGLDNPMGYFEAFFFQLVNPKLWYVSIVIASGYIRPDESILLQSFFIGIFVFAASLIAVTLWLSIGKFLGKIFSKNLFWLNVLLSVLMFLTILMVYFG